MEEVLLFYAAGAVNCARPAHQESFLLSLLFLFHFGYMYKEYISIFLVIGEIMLHFSLFFTILKQIQKEK